MSDLTIIMAVYGQPLMLRKQLDTIASYPDEVLEHLSLVIVDDHGDPPVVPKDIEDLARLMKSVKLFRVEQDIPWNQCGARNLAMSHSDGWVVMLDPDMTFPGLTVKRLMQAADKLKRGHVAKFGLKHVSSGKLDMTSPNTWLIHRDDFFAVGGYDEDYAGNKGWSDVELLDVLRTCYKVDLRPDLHADFHGTDSVPDAMVTKLDRSTKANRKKRLKKVAAAKAAGGWVQYAKLRRDFPRLRFQWKQLYPTP